MAQRRQFDGIGILLLGLCALLATTVALAWGIRPPPAVEDIDAQTSMAWAAWAMVAVSTVSLIVGAVSLLLIFETLREAKRSADAGEESVLATRLIGMAQTRAYITVERVTLNLAASARQHSLRIYIRNTGQSPAMDVFVSDVSVVRSSMQTARENEHPHRSFPSLAASQSTDGLVFFPSEFDGFQHVKDRESRTYIDVRITAAWTDVFGEKQSHPFRFASYLAPESWDTQTDLHNAHIPADG